MQVIAILNTKGGVGKSTLASALAVRAASEDKSRRVGIVDLDAQQTLCAWFKDRPVKDAPEVFGGEQSPAAAIEKMRIAGMDLVFLDGPPSFLALIKEAIDVADLVVIPLKASLPDLRSTQDAVVMARQAKKPILAVINDATKRDGTVDTTLAVLRNGNVRVADTIMHHRVSHMTGFAAGKTAAEVNGGRDKDAAEEIDSLWREVTAALKGARRGK